MDDKYQIPLPPSPDPTEKRPHPWTLWLSVAALCVAVLAAGFTGWQAWEAQQARIDAKTASDAQDDVQRSRIAAEKSASAAQELAKGMNRSAAAAEASAHAGADALSLNKRALQLNESPSLETLAAKFLKPFPSEPLVSIQTETVNNGKGAAYDINIWQGIQIASAYIFSIKDTRISHTDILGMGGAQRGKITVSNVMKFPLAAPIIADIREGRRLLYVYGWVKYKSRVFDKAEDHEPYTYCYYYAIPLEASATDPFAECPEVPSLADLVNAPAK